MNKFISLIDYPQLKSWLLEGDVSIQYQVHRDLLRNNREDLRNQIATEGWGRQFLDARNKEGHWGDHFYQPKWISTHYTILDLKNLGISQKQKEIRESINHVIKTKKSTDGGIMPMGDIQKSDICVNGMFLNYSAYFGMEEDKLISVIDFLLSEQMSDGGFNCNSNFKGAQHSSVHSTISVLEGFLEFKNNGYTYRVDEIRVAEDKSREFLLQHKLFRSDKTGDIIDKKMLMLSYPSRWKYDILRALDYFQFAGVAFDPRMSDSLTILLKKRRKDDTWPVQAKHAGQIHFEMEKTGGSSRWNTLRALRVFKFFEGAWRKENTF